VLQEIGKPDGGEFDCAAANVYYRWATAAAPTQLTLTRQQARAPPAALQRTHPSSVHGNVLYLYIENRHSNGSLPAI
jgi:hypothetical protein